MDIDILQTQPKKGASVRLKKDKDGKLACFLSPGAVMYVKQSIHASLSELSDDAISSR